MDFGDVLKMADEASFVHPEGKKVPAVVHSAVGKKSGSGNVMIAASFRVTGGPNAGKGQPVRHYLVLTQDSAWQQLSNLGFPRKNAEQFRGMDEVEAAQKIAAAILGKPCSVDLKQETFNDKLQNKVSFVNPPSASSGVPASTAAVKAVKADKPAAAPVVEVEDDDEEAALLAQLEAKRKAKAAKAAEAEAKAAAPDAPFGDGDDDDLPF